MVDISFEQIGLNEQDVVSMYKTMLLARKLDERMWLLNRAGKIPFVISCQGQEGAQIGAAYAFDTTKDYVAPYYRDLGIVLHFGMSPKEIMLNAFAKAEDPNSGGRQMPSHFSQRKNRILTGSSPVATQIPHAVGVALAGRMNREDFVCLTTLGEGSTNQGDFHEGLNFAGVHKLPVITMVQNNRVAISVPIEKQLSCAKVSDRAIGYGMVGETVDGKNPLEVYAVMKEAVERARNGGGPSLIEVMTYRLTPHSSDDDHRQYRTVEELQKDKENDPIPYFVNYLVGMGILNDSRISEIEEEVRGVVDEATEYAENAAYPEPKTILKHVYAKG